MVIASHREASRAWVGKLGERRTNRESKHDAASRTLQFDAIRNNRLLERENCTKREREREAAPRSETSVVGRRAAKESGNENKRAPERRPFSSSSVCCIRACASVQLLEMGSKSSSSKGLHECTHVRS